jgi:hypothetical protein
MLQNALVRTVKRIHELAAQHAVLVWVLTLPILFVVYISIYPSPDQTLFDVIAMVSVNGGSYYSDAFEVNWPGKMILHEAAARIFGFHLWSFRAFDFILVQFTAVAGVVFLRRAGFGTYSLLLLLIGPTLYFTAGGWVSGQRDIIAAGMSLVAAALILPNERGRRRDIVFAGGIMAFAVLVRPTYLAFAMGCLVVEFIPKTDHNPLRQTTLQRSCLFSLGLLSVWFVALVAGAVEGNLDDFASQALCFASGGYQTTDSRLANIGLGVRYVASSLNWIVLLSTLGMLLWASSFDWRRLRTPRSFLLLAGLIATVILSYLVMNKGFGYHLGGLIWIGSVGICILFDRLAALVYSGTKQEVAAAVLLTSLILTSLGCIAKLENFRGSTMQLLASNPFRGVASNSKLEFVTLLEFARTVAEESPTTSPVLHWGRSYEFFTLANRMPSSRFLSAYQLLAMDPSLNQERAWLAEFDAALNENPPVFILLDTELLNTNLDETERNALHPAARSLYDLIEREFRVVDAMGYNVLLERRKFD